MTKHEEREHFSIYGKTKPEFYTASSLRFQINSTKYIWSFGASQFHMLDFKRHFHSQKSSEIRKMNVKIIRETNS